MKIIKRFLPILLAALLVVLSIPIASAEDSNMENPDPIARPSLPNTNITIPPVGSYLPESLMQWDLKIYYNRFDDFSVDFTTGKIPPRRNYTVSQFKQALECSPPDGFNHCYYYVASDSSGTPFLSMVYSTVPLRLVPYPDFMKTNPATVYPKYALMARAKDSFTYDQFSKTPYLFNVLSVSIFLSTGEMGATFSHRVFGSGAAEKDFYSDDKCLFLESIPENFTYCYPGMTTPFVNETGDSTLGTPSGYVPPLGPGEFEDTYRAQTYLEKYSDYTEERYPGAVPLSRFQGWYLTPDAAYNDTVNCSSGDREQYRGFYFNPIPASGSITGISGSPEIAVLKGQRYAYHLYLYGDGTATGGGNGGANRWFYRSVWTNKPLKFVPAALTEAGHLTAPKLILQENSSAVVIDYDGNGGSVMRAYNSPLLTEHPEYLIASGNIYLVNDDIAVGKDTSAGNFGSDVDVNGSTVNGDGHGGGGGSWNDTKFPSAPGEGANVLDWISYVFESIGAFFSGLVEMVQGAVAGCGSFFEFLGGVFSFVPAPIWGVITLGLGLVVFLRIFAR